jgi:hypothetical protein
VQATDSERLACKVQIRLASEYCHSCETVPTGNPTNPTFLSPEGGLTLAATGQFEMILMITWRKNEWPEQPHLEPKSITDRIRANFREIAAGSFDNFMSSASPEEIRLLSVLQQLGRSESRA